MDSLLLAFWFFLPAGLANASPVVLNKLPYWNRWNTPLDLSKTFRGKRLFGDNKKWRGLLGGIVIASLAVWIQHRLARSGSVPISAGISQLTGEINYYDTSILWLGPLLGFGALMGDAIGSFFKRQLGIKPGERWFPFDQLDYIAGGLLASALVVQLNHWWQVGSVILVWFGMHLIASYIGWLLGLKPKPL